MRSNWNTSAVQFPPWEPGAPHTDGVKSWGDYCPPYFFLLFSHQCDAGGENGLLDTSGLLEYMEDDPELAPTVELLRRVPIDPTPFVDEVQSSPATNQFEDLPLWVLDRYRGVK